MKPRLKNHKSGHLLIFKDQSYPENNFSIFFPVSEVSQAGLLPIVIEGFEACAKEVIPGHELWNYALGDIGIARETDPQIDLKRICWFEISDFLGQDNQFARLLANTVLTRFGVEKEILLPQPRSGSIATGRDFFDREQEQKQIWDALSQSSDIILRAPRRYGKTTLLWRLKDRPEKDWTLCYVDLEGGETPVDFVASILAGMMKWPQCRKFLPKDFFSDQIWLQNETQARKRIKQEEALISKDWKKYVEGLFANIENNGGNFALILDEFSFLLEEMLGRDNKGSEDVKQFMDWFLEVRKHKRTRLRFLISGSEHLPTFLASIDVKAPMDDMVYVPLNLFDSEVARTFIVLIMAAKRITISPDEVKHIIELIGQPIPYFLQLFLDALAKKCEERGELSAPDISTVYEDELLGSEYKRHFDHIKSQMNRYELRGGNFSSATKAVLSRVAHSQWVEKGELQAHWQEKTGDSKGFETMLPVIKDDFYLSEKDGKISFSSKLIKDWWLAHQSV